MKPSVTAANCPLDKKQSFFNGTPSYALYGPISYFSSIYEPRPQFCTDITPVPKNVRKQAARALSGESVRPDIDPRSIVDFEHTPER